MKKTILTAAIALTMAFGSSAAASTITVDSAHGSVFGEADTGANQWWVKTKFKIDGNSSGDVYAGAFRLESDDGGALSEFLAFCLEPLETLNLPKDYAIGSLFSQEVTDNLNTLAANAWDLVTNSKTAAAFQMAAWELTTETRNTFDINRGFFKITKNSEMSNAAEAIAQEWLSHFNDDTWSSDGKQFAILNASGTQDLLTNVSVVPLPASGLLLLGGLFGAGAVARRKARKS
ncbi:VPLPA-CTERM protein sorting domain-containing protein [Cognatiyoonia koreensis]|uniref:VPLPA-CTERM protein sorting domain-containing protein n=1 Tax=Cognatiyoonia koreensis TaxID=364200 RepID=A0A1I0QK07_9RHOB|nr:VPLPA-CTERM sorting domain-containing protein [Cognatiyoonia koreensis]SEW27262.1 VPLPA-CTERM protein sorting domain-containing protein [Cognatiyoonia koreensis]